MHVKENSLTADRRICPFLRKVKDGRQPTSGRGKADVDMLYCNRGDVEAEREEIQKKYQNTVVD